VDEVIEYAGAQGKPTQRLLINDNNTEAIQKAVAAMEDNAKYRGLSLSALARTVCDQRYGYNLTRAYTLLARKKGYDSVLRRPRSNANFRSHCAPGPRERGA